jgi:hypothetical protein
VIIEKVRWAKHVTRIGNRRDAWRVSVRKPERNVPLGRSRFTWEDNIKMDLQDVGWGDMDWIDQAQARGSCLAVINAVMNFRVL